MVVCPSCGQENPAGFRLCGMCGVSLVAPAREQRKTVTVLFCDVTGSTALGESADPEALRALLARYFERMKGIVERHGGTVEKFIGDAVMAVFGVPQVHEDDALRACCAAVEMRAALPELGVQARIGVNTGEVVTGTEERLATGDAVNVAARLEQAAQPGEILIGEETLGLVRDAASVEDVEPLELEGKRERVRPHRLLAMSALAERRHESTFVGRSQELETLLEAWARSRDEERCQLVTIIGEPGIGKSRLAAELLERIDTTVVRGRCLSYGEGVTYWPVVEVLKQLEALPSDPSAAAPLRSLRGESAATTSADEIAWGFRKLLEERSPLVCVFDDIQWGEETFLDLVEHVALLSSGAALLLLCLARPELVERRSQWPVALRLQPLPASDADALIPETISSDLRGKIGRAASGNPLFVTEMVAMAREARASVDVPPNLKALLAARLDQLEQEERSVLERGAIEGEIFHRGAVQALSPDRQVTAQLTALVRKELIRPDRPLLRDDDAFRFHHLLIRDVAYAAVPKATRVELHHRFASWLDERAIELVERDEIVGYHLEQAVRYQRELGQPVDEALALDARARLTTAGRRALQRLDFGTAGSLLERAAALVPPGEIDLALEVDLFDALAWGRRVEDGIARARSLAERAVVAGDRIVELCASIEERSLRLSVDSEGGTETLEALTAEALPLFEAAGNHLALGVAFQARGQIANMRGQADALVDAFERAAATAGPAGRATFVGWLSHGRFHGSTPLSELIAWQDEQDLRDRHGFYLRTHRLAALAMLGRSGEARALLSEVRGELIERGATNELAAVDAYALGVELLAGDAAAAVAEGAESWRLYGELGYRSEASTVAGVLGQAYCEQERLEEAATWAARAAELGSSDDAQTQMLWRQVQARVLARRGKREDAELLAREAVTIGEQTDFLNAQADTYADLGEVLALAGRSAEAAEALEEAVRRYKRKENLVMAERTGDRLESLRAESRT